MASTKVSQIPIFCDVFLKKYVQVEMPPLSHPLLQFLLYLSLFEHKS